MDIMQAERKRFVYGDESLNIPGCIKNGIPEDIANTIYDQMIDFAKYAFNKSHAAAYAAISLETAYLKAHFPLEFAAGLLTSEIDDSDKLMKYIGSFKNNGVSVLPPDVQKSEVAFSIEEGNIRFGLLAVKSVGTDVAEKIVKERKKGGFKSFQDFLERTYDFISSDAVEKLAYSGALDFSKLSRRAMAEQAKPALAAVKKAMKKIDKEQMSIFDFLSIPEEHQSDYGIQNLPEYPKGLLFAHEKEATGIYLSGHPMQPYRKYLSLIATDSKYVAEKAHEGDIVNIAGVLTDFSWKVTKTGKQMLIINLEDEQGMFDVLYFPKEYEQQPALVIGDVLFVGGKVTASGSIVAKDFRDLSINPPKQLWFATNARSTFTLEKQVRNFAQRVGGVGDVIYVCSKTTRNRHPLSITIDANDNTVLRAKGEFHAENVARVDAI